MFYRRIRQVTPKEQLDKINYRLKFETILRAEIKKKILYWLCDIIDAKDFAKKAELSMAQFWDIVNGGDKASINGLLRLLHVMGYHVAIEVKKTPTSEGSMQG